MLRTIYPSNLISVNSTSEQTDRESTYAPNPTTSRTGSDQYTSWMASSSTNQKFNINLGKAEAITRIVLDNYHSTGANTDVGIRDFYVYGSNTIADYSDTVFANVSGTMNLIATLEAREHESGLNGPDEEIFDFANSVPYQYYILRIGTNHGDSSAVGIRRIKLQRDYADNYSPNFLPRNSATYALATSETAGYEAFEAVNRSNLVVAGAVNGAWLSASSSNANQKFNVDLGSAKIIKKLALDNYINGTSTDTDIGIQNFLVYGTNNSAAFNNTTYANTADLTLLGTFAATEHIAIQNSDVQVFDLTNSVAYRYYVVRVADNHGDSGNIGFRRLWFLDDYQQILPPLANASTITATTTLNQNYPWKCLKQGWELSARWRSDDAALQKIIVDFGAGNAFAATRLLLEPIHISASYLSESIQNFAIYGSNSAPSTVYADDTDLTLVASSLVADISVTDVDEHQNQYFDFTNEIEYRYYVLKIVDNYGDADEMGISHLEFYSGGAVDSVSSDSIFFGCNF